MKIFFFSQNIFFFAKRFRKHKNQDIKKGFLKTLNKRGKEHDNKTKKRKRMRNLEKTRFAKGTNSRKEIFISNVFDQKRDTKRNDKSRYKGFPKTYKNEFKKKEVNEEEKKKKAMKTKKM